MGAAAAAILIISGAAWYLVAGRGAASTTTEVAASGPAFIESGLASQLPPFLKLSGVRTEPAVSIGTPESPAYTTRFHATTVLGADTFVVTSTDDTATIITPREKQGATHVIDGIATSRKSGDAWTSELAFDNGALAALGTPRESFAGRVILSGSAEELALKQPDETTPVATQLSEATLASAPPPQVVPPAQVARPQPPPVNAPALPVVPAPVTTAPAPAPAAPRVSPAATTAASAPAPVPESPPATAPVPRPPEPSVSQPAPAERVSAPTPVPVSEVAAGTELEVKLLKKLNSGKVRVEDRFEASTVSVFAVGGRTVIPAGSVLRGIVTAVQPATRTNRTAQMTIAFDQITVNNRTYPMKGSLREVKGSGLKGDAAKIGAGAAAGAVIGAILGGTKGALAGLAVGGGGVLIATEGKEIEMAEGTVLRVKVDAPLRIE